MNAPSQEDLLGYLLGALDAREQEQVQQLVDQHPQLEARLLAMKAALAPLEQVNEPVGPPPGLARRCCQFVAVSAREASGSFGDSNPELSESDARAVTGRPTWQPAEAAWQPTDTAWQPAEASTESAFATTSPRPAKSSRLARRFFSSAPAGEAHAHSEWGWSVMDVVCSCAAALLVGALLIPALSAARFSSRSVACQNNLRSVYNSLTQYADANAGRFPQIPEAGPLATAGCVGPMLKTAGLLENDKVFACAGLGKSASQARIPMTSEVLAAENSEELQLYRQQMLGDYGYTLGYLENGKYAAVKNLGRSNYVLLADAPHNATPSRTSRNHGGWGQNCVMADGSIQFNRTGFIGTDAIYINDRNVVAPGVGPLDAVVAPGYVEPFATWICIQ